MALKTTELLKNLCTILGHEDAVCVCVKKLVSEHWLVEADAFRNVPRQRLESWGVPLKLVHEIYVYLEDVDAKDNLAGISAFINYTLRPGLAASAPMLAFNHFKSSVHRHADPEDWAARKLQGAWRCRQARKAMVKDDVLETLDALERKILSPEKAFAVRKHRAEEKLRRMVHRWRHNRAVRLQRLGAGEENAHMFHDLPAHVSHDPKHTTSSPVLQLTANASAVGPNLIFDHCIQASRGRIKDCEVSAMLYQIADELERERSELECVIHRLVTINWLEDEEDLELVEDRHWTEWEVPEKVVQVVKQKLLDKTAGNVGQFFGGVWSSVASIWGGGEPAPPKKSYEATSPEASPTAAASAAAASPPPMRMMRFGAPGGAPKRRGKDGGAPAALRRARRCRLHLAARCLHMLPEGSA